MPNIDLSGKVAIVTGGGGMGGAMTLGLARAGARVRAADVSRDKVDIRAPAAWPDLGTQAVWPGAS